MTRHITGGGAWHGSAEKVRGPRGLITAGLALLGLALLGTSCGGGDSAAVSLAPQQVDSAALSAPNDAPRSTGPAGSDALPGIPAGEREVSQTALLMNGSESFDAYSGAEISGNRMVLDGQNAGGMGLAWAIYEFSTTEDAKYPVELRVETGVDSAEYWLGIADYSAGRWQFSGPFSSVLGTLPLLPSGPQVGDYVSPGGNAYAVVLSYNPGTDSRVVVEELELKLSQNPPPTPPTGLTATPLNGSIRLNWNGSAAEGLLGYNVYYSTASFSLPEGTLVTRANDAIVPPSPNPSYELTELDPGKTYYFRVATVVGDQVESALSNQAVASSTYSLFIDELFPPRQYPGFWVYVEGAGFDPAGSNTKVLYNGEQLPADHVKDVSATGLRFRVPLSAEVEVSNDVQIKVGAVLSSPAPVVTVHPATPPKTWAHVGKTLYQSFEMYEPRGVTTDLQGNLYIAQGVAGRISVYDPEGQPLREFWLDGPEDIEVLSDGHILVKQGGGAEVYSIDQSTGQTHWALDYDTVNAVFDGGWFLAANSSGSVIYLSDANAHCIRKFEGGVQTLVIGEAILEHPNDVELDPSGNLVVADDYADSIFWFAPDGSLLDSYDGSADLDPSDGELRQPLSLATFADGSVMVTDRERDRVLRFDASHNFVAEWGHGGFSDGSSLNLPSPLGEEGHFWSLYGIAALPGGRVLVSDEFNQRSGIFNKTDGMLIQGIGDYNPLPGEFVQPQAFAVRESDGAFAVLDGATYCCTVMSRRNKVLDSAYLETGIDGDILTGRLDRTPSSVAWTNNKLYFTHGYTVLTEYSDDFENYKVLGVDWGSDPTEFKGNGAMAVDGPLLYALDRDNDRIQVFDDGSYSRSIALPDPANTNADDMVLDKDHGWLFILDRPWNNQSRILRLNADTGALIDSWVPGFGLGGVLALDPAGYVYVYYWDSDGLMHKLKPPAQAGGEWQYMCGLAPYGDGDGNVRNIYGITISPDGRYLIGDRDRRQVVILAP